MLTVLSSSTGDKLTSLANVRDFIGDPDSDDDKLLNTLIGVASEVVESYVGQPMLRQVYSETVSGFGNGRLLLSRTPIRAISAVFDSTSTDDATLLASTEVRVEDSYAGLVTRVDDAAFAWQPTLTGLDPGFPVPGSEVRNWFVTYEAGYVFPGATSTGGWLTTSTGRTLPRDVEMACLDIVRELYLGRKRDSSIRLKRVGDLEIQYKTQGEEAPGITQLARALLGPYRRLV